MGEKAIFSGSRQTPKQLDRDAEIYPDYPVKWEHCEELTVRYPIVQVLRSDLLKQVNHTASLNVNSTV